MDKKSCIHRKKKQCTGYVFLSGKILVMGGFPTKEDRNPPLEIIDLIDTTSKPIIVIDTTGSRKGLI